MLLSSQVGRSTHTHYVLLSSKKFDYRKTCGNCVKADERCHTASSVQQSQALATTAGVVAQDPLIRLAEIAALEERVSRIERMSDRSRSMNDSGEPDNSRYHPLSGQGS